MKKRTVQFILGRALIAGGIASFFASSNDDAINAKGGYNLLGLVLTGVGVGLVVPAYPNPKIGKSKFLLISNKPND